MTLNSGLEDTTLHTAAYKFQSERGVHVHPPAYRPDMVITLGTIVHMIHLVGHIIILHVHDMHCLCISMCMYPPM